MIKMQDEHGYVCIQDDLSGQIGLVCDTDEAQGKIDTLSFHSMSDIINLLCTAFNMQVGKNRGGSQ